MVILRAGRKGEVHEVGNGRLALSAVEGTHGELIAVLARSHTKQQTCTDRICNSILIHLPEAFRAFVLLLGLLVVARGWR